MLKDTSIGSIVLIVTSGVPCPRPEQGCPDFTASVPVRPEIGAVMRANSSWMRGCSAAAWSAATVASSDLAEVTATSYSWRVMYSRFSSGCRRSCCARAFSSCALSRASAASAWLYCA